ncbi:MAG: hypothetical protein H7Y08_09240 [Rhizobiaceae bacterium]|nr:hypothetical protein [Rhizobiaceae bacterium]
MGGCSGTMRVFDEEIDADEELGTVAGMARVPVSFDLPNGDLPAPS